MPDKNESTIVTALLTAANTYDEDAKKLRGTPADPAGRIADQFVRQAEEARRLAGKIEENGLDQVAYL
jgi:hypothetical protein